MKILALFGAIMLGAVLLLAGGAVALWLTDTDLSAVRDQTLAAAPPASGVETRQAIEKADIEQLLALVDADQQAQILASPEAFAQFVQQEAANQSVVRAAVANGADQNRVIHELMQRAGLRVLAQSYLNQVVRANLAADFPTEQQIQDYFDANAAQFMTPDRVHVWQIYLPVAADAAPTEVAAVEQQANEIAVALKQGKTDFASEAARHSGHVASRLSDGYMGLLKIDDLLPEIRAAIDELEQDVVSKPIRSDTGFHIIRRGEIVRGQPLKLAEVRGQIRTLLRREGETRVRQAAVEKIVEEYPTTVDTTAVEQWRTALRDARGNAPAGAVQ